jgi:hypothetical protein
MNGQKPKFYKKVSKYYIGVKVNCPICPTMILPHNLLMIPRGPV